VLLAEIIVDKGVVHTHWVLVTIESAVSVRQILRCALVLDASKLASRVERGARPNAARTHRSLMVSNRFEEARNKSRLASSRRVRNIAEIVFGQLDNDAEKIGDRAVRLAN
jgi:hypothetical protein